jgi:hypothetical protein
MATSKAIERLKRKLSTERNLPVEFDVVASSDLPLTIAWSSLKPYGLNKSAELEMVPFIHVADGSLVAIWFAIDPPAIVVLGAHGERPRIVAKDFPNFLRSISASQTGVPDIDEDCADISIPLYTARPSRAGITALQKKLDAWSQENSSLEQPRKGRGSEALRKCLHKVVKQMIRDGLSRIYTARHYHWHINFEIKRKRSGLQVQYLDYGKWYDVPTRYELRSIVEELLALVKNPKLRKYQLVVSKDGIVSVDKDRQLILVPPG